MHRVEPINSPICGLLHTHANQLNVEWVAPDSLHATPFGYDIVPDRVLASGDTSLRLGIITYVTIPVAHTNHDVLLTSTIDSIRPTMEYDGRVYVGEGSGLSRS
ncbi:hypothetical protein EGR_10983 [Echinococcus granulosus]|uniref:Uncharacterized protein n=1 Tax=Echinococcus granulosus TaxID=6210 RepID=W6TZK0_ECHGR|nr:hypothetical protein EGR_10983 [Echinococcus granulosus]EUB54158.1 hypothetical protein EGR_10983 [Echinococcus granulosus]